MRNVLPVELVNYAADKLGDIVGEVAFLGGAVVGLLVTDTGTRGPRLTDDVDVAIGISSPVASYDLDKRLLAKGFKNDMRGTNPILVDFHSPDARTSTCFPLLILQDHSGNQSKNQ